MSGNLRQISVGHTAEDCSAVGLCANKALGTFIEGWSDRVMGCKLLFRVGRRILRSSTR